MILTDLIPFSLSANQIWPLQTNQTIDYNLLITLYNFKTLSTSLDK